MNRRPPSPPPASAPPVSPAEGGPSFEAAIKRLTEIVQALERGELPLEDSLRLFEEGVKLSRVSQERLDAAERRVEQLLAVDEQGRARTAPFATDAADTSDAEPDEEPPFKPRPPLKEPRVSRARGVASM